MKTWKFPLLGLLLLTLLAGCADKTAPVSAADPSTAEAATAAPPETTVPPDGNPEDATCRGSYTSETIDTAGIAAVNGVDLTNGQLQYYYLNAIGSYLKDEPEQIPDFQLGLDCQPCPIDASVNSWQQYFLKKALDTWHTAQALVAMAADQGLPVEPEYEPNPEYYAEYMDGMPATKYMYRYESAYTPNTMHQAYLDSLPEVYGALASQMGFSTAEEMAQSLFGTELSQLVSAAVTYNTGYMYLSTMGDYLKPEDEAVTAAAADASGTTPYADFRQVLLEPEDMTSEESWESCQEEAEKMLSDWSRNFRKSEGTFADMAYRNSKDTATYLWGGLYWHIQKGALLPVLEDWIFDPTREPGDAAVIRSELGIHILYYTDGNTVAYADAYRQLFADNLQGLAEEARQTYPMEVNYTKICLTALSDAPVISYSDTLYPDIAHERFPEIPLYLQQDYGVTKYGAYPLRTYGCGITSFSMLSTYMTDTELTPPEMCRRYGSYCHSDGTDGMIFINEPAALGYFYKGRALSADEAYQALKDGYVIVSLQNYGYWTSKGHYIVLEKVDEDGVQVRDSNIYNYKKLPAHKLDRHAWKNISPNNVGWWIFEKKQVRSPLCTRCGDPSAYQGGILQADYLCQRCTTALSRRDLYLSL